MPTAFSQLSASVDPQLLQALLNDPDAPKKIWFTPAGAVVAIGIVKLIVSLITTLCPNQRTKEQARQTEVFQKVLVEQLERVWLAPKDQPEPTPKPTPEKNGVVRTVPDRVRAGPVQTDERNERELMPLFEHGFFGAEADQARQQILQKYAELFTSLKELNDICHEYVRTAKYHHGEGVHVSAVSYFMRGLMTFQSLIILSERGCMEDVRALCRTLLQACFRLAAIATDPTVVNRMVASALDLNRQRLRFFKSGELKMPPDAGNVDLGAKIAELDAAIEKLGGSMATDKELAATGGRLRDYYTGYFVLSDAAHASPTDLRSFLEYDQNGKLLGFYYGPHDRDLITYASYAISLQMDNLVNLDKVIKSGLPARFSDFQNRSLRFTSDMPGVFNPQG